jgi:hypothetical protein
MEILILIGIFAFAIAILFRSNEALDRVGEVEKEVKTIEEELGHTEAPLVSPETIAAQETPQVSTYEPAFSPAPAETVPPQAVASSVEVPPVPAEVPVPASLGEVSLQTDSTSSSEESHTQSIFPKPEDVHMNQ